MCVTWAQSRAGLKGSGWTPYSCVSKCDTRFVPSELFILSSCGINGRKIWFTSVCVWYLTFNSNIPSTDTSVRPRVFSACMIHGVKLIIIRVRPGWGWHGFIHMKKCHKAKRGVGGAGAMFWSNKQGNAIWWSCIIYRNQLCRLPPCWCAFKPLSNSQHRHTHKQTAEGDW